MAILKSIWEDAGSAFRTGNMVTKLMILNFSVFIVVSLVKIALFFAYQGYTPSYFYAGLHYLCMPAEALQLLKQPWGLFTSMFLHEGFWHVLNNLIFLYVLGGIVGDLIGDRRVLPLYLLGGLTGNLLFFLSGFFIPYGVPYALGASGAVMALAGAVLILAPDYRIMLLLLGEVKIKYVVLIMVLLDLVGIADNMNTGGHVAHIGGFIMGCWFVYRLRDGKDWAEPINKVLDRIQSLFQRSRRRAAPRRQPQMAYRMGGKATAQRPDTGNLSFQEQLDHILDKIKANGYENLTQEEKDFLYQASRK